MIDPATTAILICDMQNDFLSPDGAYARGGVDAASLNAIVPSLAGVAAAARRAGLLVVATEFTIVHGRGGVPFIAEHLKRLRPFLKQGDFAPGSTGQRTIDAMGTIDVRIEKVAYSAFHQSRLEWVLGKAGIRHLIVGGIVTNGGVASTIRHAQVLDFPTTLLTDGCATIDPALQAPNLQALASVAMLRSCTEVVAELDALAR